MKAAILAVSLFLLLSFSVASAQLTKVTVGYGVIGAVSFPAWMAKESEIFRKNGLDVQLVYFRGGTPAVMALLSRETPISQVAGATIVSASLRGADAVMIAGGRVTVDYWLMSRPEIKTAEQLKGGSVAVAVFGGQSDFVIRGVLQRLGLTPVKDVAIVQIGTLPERLSALEKGKVQAALLGITETLMAQKKGFYTLASVSLPYQGTGVATTRKFIRENPDIVRRYVKSQIEAVHRIKTDREMGSKVLVKYLGSHDKEILERTYALNSADDKLPPKQYPTLEGLKNILEPLVETDSKAKAAKPEDFVDMRFIKELDESGFIDDLYKGRKR
jgi:ABC-type nitrate/sulfonate/bicarbonate transport system substrate-binding protein